MTSIKVIVNHTPEGFTSFKIFSDGIGPGDILSLLDKISSMLPKENEEPSEDIKYATETGTSETDKYRIVAAFGAQHPKYHLMARNSITGRYGSFCGIKKEVSLTQMGQSLNDGDVSWEDALMVFHSMSKKDTCARCLGALKGYKEDRNRLERL